MSEPAELELPSSGQNYHSAPIFRKHISGDGREYFEALDGPSRGQTVWTLPDGAVVSDVISDWQVPC